MLPVRAHTLIEPLAFVKSQMRALIIQSSTGKRVARILRSARPTATRTSRRTSRRTRTRTGGRREFFHLPFGSLRARLGQLSWAANIPSSAPFVVSSGQRADQLANWPTLRHNTNCLLAAPLGQRACQRASEPRIISLIQFNYQSLKSGERKLDTTN